jgi:hypothetical protein
MEGMEGSKSILISAILACIWLSSHSSVASIGLEGWGVERENIVKK